MSQRATNSQLKPPTTSFVILLREQVRIGTTIAQLVGIVVGLLIGVALISMENAYLVFPTKLARLYGVLFSVSFVPLLLMVALIPLELLISASLLAIPALRRIDAARFYAATFAIGSVSAVTLFWLRFNLVRDLEGWKPIALYGGGLAIAMGLLVVVSLVRLESPAWRIPRLNGRVLGVATAMFGIMAGMSYVSLAGFPGVAAHAQPMIVRDPPEIFASRPSSADIPGWNVILISIDTLRADHVGSYGYSRPTSPEIDRLAGDGVIFLTARSQAPWTLPSHASMFTSLYPTNHGARFSSQHAPILDKLDEPHVTLAEMLRDAGYRTAAFTSVHWLSEKWGLLQGFNTFQMIDPHSYTAAPVVDHALQWLSANGGRPFFLFLHFFDVHNYTSPLQFDGRYQTEKYDGKVRGREHLLAKNGFSDLSDTDLRYLVAKYDGAINYVDYELGRLFSWLRVQGLYDQTLIILTSDHGEEFWDHGGSGHGFTLYDEVIRVPLIVKVAARDRVERRKVHEDVGLIDIVPTVLDYLGLPRLSFLEGVSLRPLIAGGVIPARALFAEDTYYLNTYAIVQDGYKYIDNRIPPPELLNPALFFVNVRSFFKFRGDELYRLGSDRREKINLIRTEPLMVGRIRENLVNHIRIENVGRRGVMDDKTREQLRSLGYVQ